MALLHFTPSYNLPDTRVYTLRGFIKLLSPTFKQGWKYYFSQISDAVIVVPDGKPYRYQIQCTAVPMNGGGRGFTQTVCYSNCPILFFV